MRIESLNNNLIPFYSEFKDLQRKYSNVQLKISGCSKMTNAVILDEISVLGKENQNKGLGSKILKEFLSLADKYKIIILLKAQPYGYSVNLNSAQKLADWYNRYGFEELSEEDATYLLSYESGDYIEGEMIPMMRSPR